jgi:diguanylate cyclase (GGDEF)-like protein
LSLQARLFAFFILIVVVPLGVAGFLAQRVVSSLAQARDRDRVALTTPGVLALYGERIGAMPSQVATISSQVDFNKALVAGDVGGLKASLDRGLRSSNLDFAVVADPQNNVLAEEAVRRPNYLPGITPPTARDMIAEAPSSAPSGAGRLITRTIVPVVSAAPGKLLGTLVAGVYLDNTFAQTLQKVTGIDVSIVIDGQAVGTSLPAPSAGTTPWRVTFSGATRSPVRTTLGGSTVDVMAGPLDQRVPVTGAALLTSTPLLSQATSRAFTESIVVVMIVGAAAAALLGFMSSRAIGRPLRELAIGADAIAAGDYDQNFEVRSSDEVGLLARAFNEMSSRLHAHVTELRESREELKRSLTRFGETLRSTHDLEKILQVVLDTSIDAVRASDGMLMVLNPMGGELTVAASRGVDPATIKLNSGEGIAGTVAATGEPVRVPNGVGIGQTKEAPEPAEVEPPFETGIWVPVFAQGRIFAVLALIDREDGETFTARDLDTVLSLADQAGVAIDNVVLHQEAQRLAITDGMTGVWNHRYFQLRFDQEMERSARFGRPFCLVLCDIDDFKNVNDTFGHLVGDSVLTDLARRVRSEVRDIDVLARYGGEEFVLILPETDVEGGFRAAEKVRRRVAGTPFGRECPVSVTISVGVACFPQAGADQTGLLRAADVALYQAKASGKNCTVVFHPPVEPRATAS